MLPLCACSSSSLAWAWFSAQGPGQAGGTNDGVGGERGPVLHADSRLRPKIVQLKKLPERRHGKLCEGQREGRLPGKSRIAR